MTEPRTVLLDVHHHLDDPVVASTCLLLPGAIVIISSRRDLDRDGKADLCAVLGGLLPLMERVWAQPEDGPMVVNLGATT